MAEQSASQPSASGAGWACSAEQLEHAITVLAEDGLVAFPTETVWGIAARATSVAAVERLRAWKGNGDAKPMSVLVSDLASFEKCTGGSSAPVRSLIERYWPGPLTIIVRCNLELAPGIAAPGGGTGFRCSSHPVAFALARASELRGLGPLTATSLNESGAAPATKHEEAARLVAARPGLSVLMDGESDAGPPSTVVDATGQEFRVLREGAIPKRVLEAESCSA